MLEDEDFKLNQQTFDQIRREEHRINTQDIPNDYPLDKFADQTKKRNHIGYLTSNSRTSSRQDRQKASRTEDVPVAAHQIYKGKFLNF